MRMPEQKLKEVRLHPKIGDHDRERLVNRAIEFLGRGDKVQFTMIFRGRERFHQELGRDIFVAITEQLADQAKIERPPRSEGRRMIMVLSPVKK